MRGRAAAGAVLLLVLGLAACTGKDEDDGQALPEPTRPTTTTTAPVDLTQVSLVALPPGKPTTTTRPPGPRKAAMFGKVVDENGLPVAGALVRATYYVTESKPEVIEALSGPDGNYRFDLLYGGPWRIRAWLSPTMVTLEPVALFLGAGEQKQLDLKVKAVPEVVLTWKMAPDPPLVGWAAQLAVYVVTQTVDPEGGLAREAAAGVPVTLTDSSGWSIPDGSNPATTGSDGTVRWTLSCGSEGSQSLTAVVLGREFPLSLPSCLSPASTTTATTPPPGATTSSTRPKPRPTTTTTQPKATASTRGGVRPQ